MTTAYADRPAPRRLLGALRAFGVMSGGPLVLALGATASLAAVVVALVAGDTPPTLALAGVGLLAAYLATLPWQRTWGATRAEAGEPLPGDELVPRPWLQTTRAITVDAPVAQVWPWLAQIGQDRGGFYSYDVLENLAGCRLRNADRIHPEWQSRAVGETVKLHPATGLPLARFEPDRVYAFPGWVFVLRPMDRGRTRLLARGRVTRGVPSLAYAVFVELPHFVMERRMLLGIKVRAEADRRPAADHPTPEEPR